MELEWVEKGSELKERKREQISHHIFSPFEISRCEKKPTFTFEIFTSWVIQMTLLIKIEFIWNCMGYSVIKLKTVYYTRPFSDL